MHGRWAFTGRKDGTRGVHLAQGVSEKFRNLSGAERVGVLENLRLGGHGALSPKYIPQFLQLAVCRDCRE